MAHRLFFVLSLLAACAGKSIPGDRGSEETPGSGGNSGGATGGTGVGATGADGGTGGGGTGGFGTGGVGTGGVGTGGVGVGGVGTGGVGTGGVGTGGVGTGGLGTGGVGAASGGDAGSAGTMSACSSSIVATEAQNYSFASYLQFPVVSVKPGANLTFEWGGVSEDLLGHPMNPMTDVDMVEWTLWDLDVEAFAAELHDDTLSQSDLSVVASLATGQQLTSTTLFELTSVGVPLTPELILPYMNPQTYPPERHTYMFSLASGTVLGEGTRMLQAFKLDPASENTTVTLTNDSVSLNWKVNLDQITSPRVPARTPAITIDWSQMTLNAMAQEFRPFEITEVRVGAFVETPAELAAAFLDIEQLAGNIWRGDVPAGTSSLSLTTLIDVRDAGFPGIEDEYTWILALFCGSCSNPAPWYLTILEPCSR